MPQQRRTIERREYIARQVNANGVVTFKEIRDEFEQEIPRSSLVEDVEFLKRFGLQLEQAGGNIYRLGTRTSETLDARKKIQPVEKSEIARLGASLILGVEENHPGSCEDKNEALFTRNEILKNDLSDETRKKLTDFWSLKYRTIALDAGTTIEGIVHRLSKAKLSSSSLTGLRIITNCPSHFVQLSKCQIPVEVLVVGGRLRPKTDAIAGDYAQRCLDSWDLSIHMCILGATKLDTEGAPSCYCHNSSEARIKGRIMVGSHLKFVAADHSKFCDTPENDNEGIFASLDKGSLDAVITNHQAKARLAKLPEFVRPGVITKSYTSKL